MVNLYTKIYTKRWFATKVATTKVLALNKEVILGINLYNRREPNKALIGVGSLRSTARY